MQKKKMFALLQEMKERKKQCPSAFYSLKVQEQLYHLEEKKGEGKKDRRREKKEKKEREGKKMQTCKII